MRVVFQEILAGVEAQQLSQDSERLEVALRASKNVALLAPQGVRGRGHVCASWAVQVDLDPTTRDIASVVGCTWFEERRMDEPTTTAWPCSGHDTSLKDHRHWCSSDGSLSGVAAGKILPTVCAPQNLSRTILNQVGAEEGGSTKVPFGSNDNTERP